MNEISDKHKRLVTELLKYNHMKGYNQGIMSGIVIGMLIEFAVFHIFGII